jgi:DNA-binding CsgD family transcriptional regulator
MKKIHSIDEILKELEADEGQYNVIRVIYSYYLTDREREVYQAFLLNLSGKPQKEIGILLNIVQSHVSKFISLLVLKMQRLAKLFTPPDIDELVSFITVLKAKLKPRHYDIVSFVLGGNRYIDIAHHLKCSPPNIFKTNSKLRKYLSKQEYALLNKYKDITIG